MRPSLRRTSTWIWGATSDFALELSLRALNVNATPTTRLGIVPFYALVPKTYAFLFHKQAVPAPGTYTAATAEIRRLTQGAAERLTAAGLSRARPYAKDATGNRGGSKRHPRKKASATRLLYLLYKFLDHGNPPLWGR